MIGITAQETVYNLDAFLYLSKHRRHWFIDNPPTLAYVYVGLILTALDDKGNIIRYFACIGYISDAPYDERTKKYEAWMEIAKQKIKELPEDFTEGLWEISR